MSKSDVVLLILIASGDNLIARSTERGHSSVMVALPLLKLHSNMLYVTHVLVADAERTDCMQRSRVWDTRAAFYGTFK